MELTKANTPTGEGLSDSIEPLRNHCKLLKHKAMLEQTHLSKMDGVEAARVFHGLNPKDNQLLGFIAQSYNFIVGAGAIPARLYLRKNLGERAFSPAALLLSFLFFGYYSLFSALDDKFLILGGMMGNLLAMEFAQKEGFVLIIIFNVFFNACVWFLIWMFRSGIAHFKNVIKNAKHGGVHYSFYRGEGWLFGHRLGGKMWGFDIDDRWIRMIIEPLYIIKNALFVLIGSVLFGGLIYLLFVENHSAFMVVPAYLLIILGWLNNLSIIALFSGLCLFLEEFGIKMRIRHSVLDMVDGEYDMAFVVKMKEDMQEGKGIFLENTIAEQIYQNDGAINPIQVATMPDFVTPIKSISGNSESSIPQELTIGTSYLTLHDKLREQYLKND